MPTKRTRYEDLKLAGDELTSDELWEGIRQLARDDRFAAVVAWLERSEAAWTLQAGASENALEHGKLASIAGSLGALVRLKAQLREKLRKPKDTAPPSPAD